MSNCVRKTMHLNNLESSTEKVKSDRLFDPSVDMMVNDFDDEATLEEEEALAAGEAQDPNAELSNLQREGDMPLSELLKLYGYGEGEPDQEEEEEDEDNEEEEEPDQSTVASVDSTDVESTGTTRLHRPSIRVQSKSKQSALCQLYENLDTTENEQDAARVLRSVSRTHSENEVEEEDEDYDYSPDEDEWRKKTAMVGSNYQAIIPEGLSHYDDALPYENEDKLIWDPSVLTETQVEDYLRQVRCKKRRPNTVQSVPNGKNLKDDEQALFLLQQCGHNTQEALRRKRIQVPGASCSLWSEDECRNFEAGLRGYGKDFHQIQLNKVRTRSVAELVQFYYLWKKTERHDVFANKSRLEKKKYALHPGITDFMDRFLDEQDLCNHEQTKQL